jgi:hypothetical protein
MSNLILPGNPEFDETLATTLPPDWQEVACRANGDYGFVVDRGSGMIRIVDSSGLTEYLEGGEYDERLESIDCETEMLLAD